MRNEQYMQRDDMFGGRWQGFDFDLPRKTMLGIILMVSLLAFEMFNFDTTQYALRNLLGDVRFVGLQWASILAIAFCSIDFAGLIRLFTPQRGGEEPKEVWYLMGAWLLGATMNAIMTWWAVSLTLLNHDFGNEVLSRQQLLDTVPIFVAVLVWLTRILFIGAFTVAGEHLFDFSGASEGNGASRQRPLGQPKRAIAQPKRAAQPQRASSQNGHGSRSNRSRPQMPQTEDAPDFLNERDKERRPQRRERQTPQREQQPSKPKRRHSRVRQRPPRPNGTVRRVPAGMHASSRRGQ